VVVFWLDPLAVEGFIAVDVDLFLGLLKNSGAFAEEEVVDERA
jgi:hypothetical protein